MCKPNSLCKCSHESRLHGNRHLETMETQLPPLSHPLSIISLNNSNYEFLHFLTPLIDIIVSSDILAWYSYDVKVFLLFIDVTM